MASDEEVVDSPRGWVARHIRDYVATGGRKGHRKYGATNLLLTTRGRRTGKLRRTALIYSRDGDRYLVVPSNGGSDQHPNWYLNLQEHPEVHVQIGAEAFRARARTADADEEPRLWRIVADAWPTYEEYQAKSPRHIPVVILEPLPAAPERGP